MGSLLKSPWLRCDELELGVVDYMIFWETFGFFKQFEPALGRAFSKAARAARARLALENALCLFHFARPSHVLSPFQIRAALLFYAQDAGAAWKPSVFTMLDRATTRSAHMDCP